MSNSKQRERYPHLFWIGGSPCGGKSTIAQIIAKNCNLNLYSIDDQLNHLMKDITPAKQPALCQWEAQSWEERWMQPVDQLLDFAIHAYDEVFWLCMEEITNIPSSQPTLIEGNPLRPELIMPYLFDRNHAIWLIAEGDDLRHYYSQREWAQHVVKETSNPDLAFTHWMDRDVAFANRIREDCETYHLPYIMSDRQQSLKMKARKVAAHFQFPCDL